MPLTVLIPLIFAGLFLLTDILLLVKMICLFRKAPENSTLESLKRKLDPYLTATAIISILMAISMILVTVLK